MSGSRLRRPRTPFLGVPASVFSDLADFVRRVAPRWLDGCRSHTRLSERRGRLRELVRSRRRGYRLVTPPNRPAAARPVRRPD